MNELNVSRVRGCEWSIVSFPQYKKRVSFFRLYVKKKKMYTGRLFSLEWFACTRCLCSRSTPVGLFWESGGKHAIILVTIFLPRLAERRRTSTRTSRRDGRVRYFSSIARRPFSTDKARCSKKSESYEKKARDYSAESTKASWQLWYQCLCEKVTDKLPRLARVEKNYTKIENVRFSDRNLICVI